MAFDVAVADGGATVGEMARRSKAMAAINGSYFDIHKRSAITYLRQGRNLIEALQSLNDQPISRLSLSANIPISRLTVVLFQLEMKGMLKLLAGGCYHLYT